VKVRVSKTHSSLTGFVPFFNDITLSSEVEMRIERELVKLTADGGIACP
jgi:hypothetical protein